MKTNSFIPPEYLEPHYSTKLTKSTYSYILKYYSEELFGNICRELNVPTEFMLEDDNWHSNYFNSIFCNKLIEETDDPQILYSIGKEFLSPENINFFEYQFLKFMPPYLAFLLMPSQAQKVNNVFKLKTLNSRPGFFKYEIISIKKEEPHEGVFSNTLGCFDGFRDLYKLNSFSSDYYTTNDGRKIFEIQYKSTKYWLSKIIFALITIGIIYLFNKVSISNIKSENLETALVISSSLLLFLTFGISLVIKQYFKMIKANEQYYLNTREKNHKIHEKSLLLDSRYKEANHIKKMCFELLGAKDSASVISNCLDHLKENKNYTKSMIMLVSEKRKKLYTADFRGFESNQERLRSLDFVYPSDKDDALLFANIIENGKTVHITNILEFQKKLNPQNQKIVEDLKVNSLIISPLQDQDKKYGLLIIGETEQEKVLMRDDVFYVESISSLLSMFFQNYFRLESEMTLRSIFQKYVPRAVLEEIDNLQDSNKWRIPPQVTDVSSMFIDLRGFTTITECLSPENVFTLLNIFVEYVTKIVGERGGIVDNIIADEIVIFFTANPKRKTRHSSECLLSAIEILAYWDGLNNNFLSKGFPKLRAGIGIHSGFASTGTVGSEIRSNYTCLGDTINVASRLQSMTKDYIEEGEDGIILISEEGFRRANINIKSDKLMAEEVRGRKSKIDIHKISYKSILNFDVKSVPHLSIMRKNDRNAA